MIKFTMPLNWQHDYFTRINFNQVSEVYGKLREDFPGGGKSSMAQAEPSKKDVRNAVSEAHKRNMKFNYLINTTCIGNRELTRAGYKKIRKLLDWLSEIQVDTVTLALPYLVEIVKKYYSHFTIAISTQTGVDCLEKVNYWRNIGADTITLSHVTINRNFKEIERIAKHSDCELQLIVNLICKRQCPYVTLHGNFNAHSSQSNTKTNRYNMDYYFVTCLARNFSDPISIIQSNWIRPEDLAIYENLGIHKFKIVERGLTTEALATIIDAYSTGSYDGNFMDLVPTMSKYVFMKPTHFTRSIKELFRMSFVNIFKLKKAIEHIRELKKSESYSNHLGVYIDNKSLNGVIKTFIEKDCLNNSCKSCDTCNTLVKEKIKIIGSKKQYDSDLKHLKDMLDGMVSGSYY